MTMMKYNEALREGMRLEMQQNDRVILMGEDIGKFGGFFGVTKGLYDEFGSDRVIDMPISEIAIIGAAIGSAATGLRPVAELMYCDFVTVAMDQIVNQAAKMRYMSGGQLSLPLVIRMACGAGPGSGAQHGQSLEGLLTHIPGLKVVYPTTPQDALGLMRSAIEDDNPVIFMEHKFLYDREGEVTNTDPIPLGKADIKRSGHDVTLIATGKMVGEALQAADILMQKGIDAEVIDPRSLYPFDKDCLASSLAKTRHAVIITEENRRGAYSETLSAFLSEDAFDSLDRPVKRIGALDTPIPYAPVLTEAYLPNYKDIIQAVQAMF